MIFLRKIPTWIHWKRGFLVNRKILLFLVTAQQLKKWMNFYGSALAIVDDDPKGLGFLLFILQANLGFLYCRWFNLLNTIVQVFPLTSISYYLAIETRLNFSHFWLILYKENIKYI
jgi:hypothetical protein